MNHLAELLARGTRHHQAGELAQAESIYRQILGIQAEHADALHQLGALVIARGDAASGITLIERAIRADSSQANFYVSLGEGFRQIGDIGRAALANERALEIEPTLRSARMNLGLLREQMGQWTEAIRHWRELVHMTPDDPQAYSLLGRALAQQGEIASAEEAFRGAIRLAPRDLRAHYNLGAVLQAERKLSEAADCYRSAIAIHPEDARSHNNLGTVLEELGALAEAESHFRRAISAEPDFAEARSNLAAALVEQFQHEKALAHARRAVELRADSAAAHHNLALAMQGLGMVDEAIKHYRRAIELAPNQSKFYSALLYALNFHPACDADAIAAEHRAWGERHAKGLTASIAPHVVDRSRDRRLRIGYVSPYFRDHAVNFFVEPILASHDPAGFEVFCYADVRNGEQTTRRLRNLVEHWRETVDLDDEQLSRAIRDDRIDILVDLSGHIGGNRLLTFARKPAPVQITYIGYQNTTGMAAMDYRLTDAYCDPPGATERHYTEQLVRLPRSFFCYLPSPDAPPVGELPAHARGYVTFGAFNNFAKVTPQVLATWARILSDVPDSRIVLLADEGPALRRTVREAFAAHGVAPERLDFVGRVSRGEYLARISQIDIALDPFPFNGHTTTCDCLWQGVPVVTLSGQTYASRFGASGLATLGLGELIADSPDAYWAIAVELARDLDRMATVRATLRQRMAASVLLDHRGFTRNLEAEYRKMWATWCAT